MPTPTDVFTGKKLIPLFENGRAWKRSIKLQAALTLARGTILAAITTGVNAVQTLTITASAGTFKLMFRGYKTAAIAYNANAAAIQAAIEAMPSVGSGNCAVTGSGPFTLTFQNALAARPVETMTVPVDDNTTGGTVTVVSATTGIFAKGYTTWNGALAAAPAQPTVTAVSGGSAWGDGTNPFAYFVSVTFYNSTGETTMSPATQVIITSSNRTFRLGQITSVPTYIDGARVYVNGTRVADIARSGSTIPQTDIATIPTGQPGTAPSINQCFQANDGTHRPRIILEEAVSTDANGAVTMGSTSAGSDGGFKQKDIAGFCQGTFRVGDLANPQSTMDRFGRFLDGDYNVTEGIYSFAD